MYYTNGTVSFEPSDMGFVDRFGIADAAQMVTEHYEEHSTPFLYESDQLAYLLGVTSVGLSELLNDTPSFYRALRIPKRSGGFRELNEPLSPLDKVQSVILTSILYRIDPSLYSTAYFPGSRLVYNAIPHLCRSRLLKMDITDFFGSIHSDMVYTDVFKAAGYPDEIADQLTGLCTLNGALPQGACTSPAISNLVMRRFDNSFGQWCRRRNLNYTRYCDDIAVSGNAPLYPAYIKAKSMLREMGFGVNEKKTVFVTDASRQTVTGIVVNKKLSVPSDYKRKLRQELYYVLKYGIENVIRHQNLLEYKERNYPGGRERYYSSLMGRLNHVLSVEPDNEYFLNAKYELQDQRMTWT